MKKIVFVFAALVSFSTPALATRPQAQERVVKVHDLDLSRYSDQRLLRKRINNAMEVVCGSYEGATGPGEEDEAARITECRKDVRAQIMQHFSLNR